MHGDDGEDPPDLSEGTSGTVFTTTYAVVRLIQVSIPSSFTASMPGGTRVSVAEPQEWWYCWSSFLRYCDLCLRPRLCPSRVRTILLLDAVPKSWCAYSAMIVRTFQEVPSGNAARGAAGQTAEDDFSLSGQM